MIPKHCLIRMTSFCESNMKKKAYKTCYCQAVTHPSTNQAHHCFTSGITWQLELSITYGQWYFLFPYKYPTKLSFKENTHLPVSKDFIQINQETFQNFIKIKARSEYFFPIYIQSLSIIPKYYLQRIICFCENKMKKKAYNTWYSQAVTHPSTNQAHDCLTSVIRWELVLSIRYGCRHFLPLLTSLSIILSKKMHDFFSVNISKFK